MRLPIILLALTLCFYSISAQVATDNGTVITIPPPEPNPIEDSIPYTDIDLAFVENNPFLLGLINYGSQVVVGHVSDSRLFDYHTGNYTKIYSVKKHSDATLNVSADVQLTLSYYYKLRAKFIVNYDYATKNREVITYSYEYQNYSLSDALGFNVSYNGEQDTYQRTTFSGIEDTLNYQSEDNADTTTNYNGVDWLHNFANFTAVNPSSIYDNETIQYSFNAALRGLRTNYYTNGLLVDYDQLNVTQIHSIDTYWKNNTGDYFRYDFQVNTVDKSARVVAVVLCPSYYYNPYYYPYYPYPYAAAEADRGSVFAGVASDGTISSNSASEAQSASAPPGGANPNVAQPPPTTAETQLEFDPTKVNVGGAAPNVAPAVDPAAASRNLQGTIKVDLPVIAEAVTNVIEAAKPQETAAAPTDNGATEGEKPADVQGTTVIPPIYPDPTLNPNYYYTMNCLFGNLDYYWFVNFKDSPN